MEEFDGFWEKSLDAWKRPKLNRKISKTLALKIIYQENIAIWNYKRSAFKKKAKVVRN